MVCSLTRSNGFQISVSMFSSCQQNLKNLLAKMICWAKESVPLNKINPSTRFSLVLIRFQRPGGFVGGAYGRRVGTGVQWHQEPPPVLLRRRNGETVEPDGERTLHQHFQHKRGWGWRAERLGPLKFVWDWVSFRTRKEPVYFSTSKPRHWSHPPTCFVLLLINSWVFPTNVPLSSYCTSLL